MAPHSKISLRLTPLGRYYAILVLGIFLAAMVRQVNLLLLVAGLIAAPLCLSWVLTRQNLRGLLLRRRVPSRICAGDLLVVELEITHRRSRGKSWNIQVVDTIVRQATSGPIWSETPRLWYPYLDATEPHVLAYRGRIPFRGVYRFGPVTVSTRFPLGLFEAKCVVPLPHELVAYPRLGRLTNGRLHRHDYDYEGKTRSERVADRASGDFYGLRAWQVGDSPRLIHWRSSARHGELLVRQFDRPRQRHVKILLNLCCENAPEANGDARENAERAIRFVATLIHELCRRGGRSLSLGVVAGDRVWISGGASSGFLNQALELLARVEPAHHQEPEEFLNEARQKGPRLAEVIVVTLKPLRRGSEVRQELVNSTLGGRFDPNLPEPSQLWLNGCTNCEVIDVSRGDLDKHFIDAPGPGG